jgi:membrane-bound serine protease (ClpP class)
MGGEGGSPVRRLIKRFKRGEETEKEEEILEESGPDPMTDKVVNDTVAWIQTIAAARGRNEEWAKKAVIQSFSVTETEAVKERIVDFVAADVQDLLTRMDGLVTKVIGHRAGLIEVEVRTAGAEIVRIPMSKRQQFLTVITNPNIAYLLMLLGTLGLIFEFTHPGVGFPGIAGLICLLLALYAFQALPVSYAAMALVVLGLGLLIAEIKVVSHGLLAVGGVISLTLGSLMLFESPDPNIQVSLQVILPSVAALAAIILFVVQRALSAQAAPVATGAAGLLGEIGVASTALNPDGKVFVHGELWNATSPRPIPQGQKIRILRVEGLQLFVEPHEQPAARRRAKR